MDKEDKRIAQIPMEEYLELLKFKKDVEEKGARMLTHESWSSVFDHSTRYCFFTSDEALRDHVKANYLSIIEEKDKSIENLLREIGVLTTRYANLEDKLSCKKKRWWRNG